MRLPLLLPLVLALSGQSPPHGVRTVEVQLSSFDFDPDVIRLRAGEAVVLRLVNASGGGHNFAAPQFFAAARNVAGPVHDGVVELRGRETAEIRLVPTRGRYRLRCTHTLHGTLGMRGRIVVD